MSEYCNKCGTKLICFAGCSAHPSNWYCPACSNNKSVNGGTTSPIDKLKAMTDEQLAGHVLISGGRATLDRITADILANRLNTANTNLNAINAKYTAALEQIARRDSVYKGMYQAERKRREEVECSLSVANATIVNLNTFIREQARRLHETTALTDSLAKPSTSLKDTSK